MNLSEAGYDRRTQFRMSARIGRMPLARNSGGAYEKRMKRGDCYAKSIQLQ